MTPERITIPVNMPDAHYPIWVGPGLRLALPELLAERDLMGRAAIVTNATLAPIYGEALSRQIGAALITVPDGEQHKTLDSVRSIYDGLIDAGLDRRGVVIALGGGVIGDMAGFAAATYLRGVAFVQVPTSLLAMVDASVGGKVGVDVPQGKNLIGAFKQPEAVIIDTDVLATLPDTEWRCGVAEAIKAGLLRDTFLLDEAIYRRDRNPTEFLRRAIQVKVDVVQQDPYERNIRAWLNLGHTFGHALERASGYQWRHGEAVAVGLVAAARLSAAHGLCDPALPNAVESLVAAVGLPTRFGEYNPAAVRAAMGTDKKRQADRLRFVLLADVGEPVIADDVPDALVLSVLESLRV